MATHAYPNTQLLIDNQWVDAADGRTQDVLNPATGQVIGKVAHAGIPDLDRALAAAQRGFEVWRDTPAHERAAVMRRAAALRARHEELLAAIPEQELREFVRRHYPHWGVKEREEGSGG